MMLSRLDLMAFGRFTDVSIDLSAGPKRFHLIYGPNESGKSTSLRAITSLLFGMPQAAEDCFVHRTDQIRVGGLLVDPASGASLECVRRRGRKATLRDAADKEPIDEAQLESMLGGINRETFLARFGLSYESLVEGGAAILKGNGDLGQILFAAGAGVGRLREIQAELDQAACQLFMPRGSKATINAGLKKLEEDRKTLRESQVPTAEFARLRESVEAKQREAESLDQALRECVMSLARMQNWKQAQPLLPSWRSATEAFEKVADAPALDEAFTERRRQISADREKAESRHKDLESRLKELNAKLQSFGSDPVVMSHELEIQAAFQEISAREKAEQDRVELIRARKRLGEEIGGLLTQLSAATMDAEHVDSSEVIEQSLAKLHVSDALRARIRELAAAHAGLISKQNDASDLVKATKRRLADVTQELEALGTIGDPSLLASVIESTGNPESEMDALQTSRHNCEALRRRCELMLQRLEGFEGDLDQAIKLTPPSHSSVRQLAESLRSALHDVTQQESLLDGIKQDRDAIEQQILEAQADLRLPTLSELESARRLRDRAADRVADGVRTDKPSVSDVEELREQIRVADHLADTMREHSEQVHRRESLSSQLQVFDAKIRQAKESIAAAHGRFESAKSEWDAAWRSRRISAGQPEQMQEWLVNHEKLCDLIDQLESEEKRFAQIQGRIRRATTRLGKALDTVHCERPVGVASSLQGELFEDPNDDNNDDDDLISRYDEAVALRSRWTRERQQYDALRHRRDELAEELPQAEARLDAAQKVVEEWHKDWRRLTESFVKSDRVGTAEVLQMLDHINQLDSLKRQRDDVLAKLQAIDEDDASYAAKVARLAKAIDHEASDQQPPVALAHAMYGRLQAERSARKGRETLQDQIESSNQRLLAAAEERAECDVVLKQFCAEAGCDSPDQLPDIERRSRERRELQASLRELTSQLMYLAGDQSLEDFIAEAAEQQSAVLEVDIERAEEKQHELRQQIERVHREIGAAQNELNRIDGGSRASDLAQSIQVMAGVIRADVESYARLKVGALMLKRAIEHYRRENQNPVLALANEYFCLLTCGEYLELKPDYDAAGVTTLFGLNASGEHVPVSGMSTGTADALYLALRLASLQHQMKDGKAIPVVIDDCLVQLDDSRAAAALRAFSDLSEKTQVILFTHHQHLCQLAEESLGKDDYHVHQIGVEATIGIDG